MKTVKVLAIFLGGSATLTHAMETPLKPTSYLELLPAEIGGEVQAYDAMNKLQSVGYGRDSRQKAMDILSSLKETNPMLLKNQAFVYGFLEAFIDKFPFIYPMENSILQSYIESLNNPTASQWLKNYMLLQAAIWENKDAVAKLLAEGAQINARVKGDLPLLHVLDPRRIDVLALLLEKGADVNMTDKYGRSALSMAILEINPEAVQLLVKQYAKQSSADYMLKWIGGAIRELTRYREDAIPDGIKDIKDIISALADAGLDLKSRNKEGKTVIQQMNDIWDYYKKDYPADKYPDRAAGFNQIFPEIIAFLKSKGAH